MKSKKFDLFIGCFPGGDVYCNKAVCEHGDYKQIAFIDYTGKLKLYVSAVDIPGDILLRIEHDAETKAANYKNYWEGLPELTRYEKLLDSAGIGGLIYLHKLPKDFSLSDKIDFFEWIVYDWIPHSEKILFAIEEYKNSKYYCKGIE